MHLRANREPRAFFFLAVVLLHIGIIYLLALHINYAPFNASISVRILNSGLLAVSARTQSETAEQKIEQAHASPQKLNPHKAIKIAPVLSQLDSKKPAANNEENSATIDSPSTTDTMTNSPAEQIAPSIDNTAASSRNTSTSENEIVIPNFDAAYLNNPSPIYPSLSRELGEQGRVLLRVLVAADGSVQKIELYQSSGFERLDRAAGKTVSSWHFIPGKKGSQPISAWVIVPIIFSLRG